MEVMFHHRYATSTPDVRNACHPFSTKDLFDHEYIGMHNGVINNPWQLKAMHEKQGVKYVSLQPKNTSGIEKFNDSEALLYDLANYFEGKVEKLTAYGNNAFIVTKVDAEGKPVTLYFGHNTGNPLVMKKSKTTMVISSLGDGKPVPPNVLHKFDYKTKQITTEPMEIPLFSSYQSASVNHTTAKPGFGSGYRSGGAGRNANRFPQYEDDDFDWQAWQADQDRTIDARIRANRRANEIVDEAFERHGFGEYTEKLDDGLTNEEEDAMLEAALQELEKEERQEYAEDYFGYDKGEFVIRAGTQSQIMSQILTEAEGNLHKAMQKARGEQAGALEEVDRLNDMKLDSDDEKALEAISYYSLISDYAVSLSEIGDELLRLAQSEADREDKGADALLFQIPANLKPTSKNLTT